MSRGCYLALCARPVQFEKANPVNCVFFDEANKQVRGRGPPPSTPHPAGARTRLRDEPGIGGSPPGGGSPAAGWAARLPLPRRDAPPSPRTSPGRDPPGASPRPCGHPPSQRGWCLGLSGAGLAGPRGASPATAAVERRLKNPARPPLFAGSGKRRLQPQPGHPRQGTVRASAAWAQLVPRGLVLERGFPPPRALPGVLSETAPRLSHPGAPEAAQREARRE